MRFGQTKDVQWARAKKSPQISTPMQTSSIRKHVFNAVVFGLQVSGSKAGCAGVIRNVESIYVNCASCPSLSASAAKFNVS